jgi:hypothetical protein
MPLISVKLKPDAPAFSATTSISDGVVLAIPEEIQYVSLGTLKTTSTGTTTRLSLPYDILSK